MSTEASSGIDGVVTRLESVLVDLADEPGGRRAFPATYLRTTQAVGRATQDGLFEDPAWVEQWDVAFAERYLDAVAAQRAGARVPRPWQVAFNAPAELHDLIHVLLGINAHINYDLPQALLAVIPPRDFEDPPVMERRRRDHEAIDAVLSRRVAAEDEHFEGKTWRDRLLAPLNHASSRRFLRESRRRVWHNTDALHTARLAGPEAYEARLFELEILSAAKIADLVRPGPVLLRLALTGFGVTLPPAAAEPHAAGL